MITDICVVNWQEFIMELMRDYRSSPNDLAVKTGLSSVAIYKLTKGLTQRPNQNTIHRIEKAYNIRINDSDPKNITYTKVNREEKNTEEDEDIVREFNEGYSVREWHLPLLGDIPAGLGEFNGYHQTETVTLDSRRQFMLRVDRFNGESMVPLLKPGDLVICDLQAKVRPGDIVAAKWGENQAAIKLYGDNSKLPGTVILESYNRNTGLVILNLDKELLTIAKVIHIIKSP